MPMMTVQGGPGTGTLNGPPLQHNYKRAVYRAAPREFLVEVLPPTKFGSGYCYGIRIDPVLTGDLRSDDSSGKSGSSRSTSQYDVWRRWEDCLWFQEMLEEEYAHMARNKRRGLAAGKGVKKKGVYIHSDGAASFESLPPGPEANSIAKDIHEILPKLSKKGTLFRPSQATIDQRGREFKALIEALWADNVPTLLKDLREERVVRDFFAYWQRDKDLKRKSKGSMDASSRLSVASSFHFSASTTELSSPTRHAPSPAPSTATSTTIRAPSAAFSAQAKGKAPMYRHSELSLSGSNLSRRSSSSSSSGAHPQPMAFSVSARGSLRIDGLDSDDMRSRYSSLRGSMLSRSTSSRAAAFSSPIHTDSMDDFPFVFPPEGQHAALQALPEDQELVSDVETLSIQPRDAPPPVRRGRTNSCPKPNRANRNGFILTGAMVTPPESPASEHGIPHSLHAEVESAWAQNRRERGGASMRTAESLMDSRPTSVALSASTAESPPSSWRMSVASETSVATAMTELSSVLGDSFVDMDCDSRSSFSPNSPTASMFDVQSPSMNSFMESWSPPHQYAQLQRPTHAPRASVATMNSIISNSSVDAVLPRRLMTSIGQPSSCPDQQRSFSARSPERGGAIGYDVPDDINYESADDVLSDYFYDASQSSTTPPRTPPPVQDAHRAHGVPVHLVSTPDRYPKAFQDRPPGQFHLPWSPPASPPPVASPKTAESYTLKVMLQESIVLIRATYGTPLADVRERIREKFANQEEIPLSPSFLMGYVSFAAQTKAGMNGRARSVSLSSSQDHHRSLHYIHSEEEWHSIVATCAGKLTIRILDTHL